MNNPTRVAVITGASQGIGAALVQGYRTLGYAVVANSRTIAASDDPMVLAVPGDIGEPGVGRHIIDAALEHFGRVDTVVNNAGIFIAKPFTEYTDADYDAITGVNLRGFFEVTRAAVDAMGWTFVRSQLWHRSGRKGPSVVQVLTFRPGNSVELAGAKVVHVEVVAIATSPNSARVEIGVHARKFPHGLFRIAKVDDVAIGDDSRTWANAVKVRLAEELATAKIPGGGLIDDNAIAGAITTLLG